MTTEGGTYRDYLEFLGDLHCRLAPRTYLEIGINHGDSLRRVLPGTKVVGIDPGYFLLHPPPADTLLFRKTSDDFFAEVDVAQVLDGQAIDLAFIDGMHLFEYVLRDFLNVARHTHERSVVVLHDTMPPNAAAASRTQGRDCWAGDVWKVVFALRALSPGLTIQNAAMPPTGLTIIRDFRHYDPPDPAHLNEVVKELEGTDYGFYHEHVGEIEQLPTERHHLWRRVRLEPLRSAAVPWLRLRRRLRIQGPRIMVNRLKRRVKRLLDTGRRG